MSREVRRLQIENKELTGSKGWLTAGQITEVQVPTCPQKLKSAELEQGAALPRVSRRCQILRTKTLFHLPGVACAQQFGQIPAAALGDDSLDLIIHHIFVARHVAPGTEDPDGRGEVRSVFHM